MRKTNRYVLALATATLALSACSPAGDDTAEIATPTPRAETTRPAQPLEWEIDMGSEADFVSEDGALAVSQIGQMSVVITAPEGVIYADPTGGGDPYASHAAPDIILISHEHHEHYDVPTLEALIGPETRLVVPPFVMETLPEHLRVNAVSLESGESAVVGDITVDAIPSYGLNGPAEQWHPEGRGNGYIVTIDDRRTYIAGSTEAIPEMLELRDIYLALVPLYPPYALDPEDAVTAVTTFVPENTYIYQYSSEHVRDDFVNRMIDVSAGTTVIAPDIAS